MGPGERFFIEYIGRQSTSEADDGQRGPHEGCSENQSPDLPQENAVEVGEDESRVSRRLFKRMGLSSRLLARTYIKTKNCQVPVNPCLGRERG